MANFVNMSQGLLFRGFRNDSMADIVEWDSKSGVDHGNELTAYSEETFDSHVVRCVDNIEHHGFLVHVKIAYVPWSELCVGTLADGFLFSHVDGTPVNYNIESAACNLLNINTPSTHLIPERSTNFWEWDKACFSKSHFSDIHLNETRFQSNVPLWGSQVSQRETF